MISKWSNRLFGNKILCILLSYLFLIFAIILFDPFLSPGSCYRLFIHYFQFHQRFVLHFVILCQVGINQLMTMFTPFKLVGVKRRFIYSDCSNKSFDVNCNPVTRQLFGLRGYCQVGGTSNGAGRARERRDVALSRLFQVFPITWAQGSCATSPSDKAIFCLAAG